MHASRQSRARSEAQQTKQADAERDPTIAFCTLTAVWVVQIRRVVDAERPLASRKAKDAARAAPKDTVGRAVLFSKPARGPERHDKEVD